MYTKNFILFVAAGASAANIFVERSLATSGGWSLQSSTAISGLTSCGDDAFCPSSFSCVPASQSVAAACCPTSSNCIGTIEGASVQTCADTTWSLYKNDEGNGFCCANGEVGAIDNSAPVGAGFCTSHLGSNKAAQLVLAGSGSSSSAVASAASTAVASTSAVSASVASTTFASETTAATTGGSAATKSASGDASTATTKSKSSKSTASSGSTATGDNASSPTKTGSSNASGTNTSGVAQSTGGAIQNGVASGLGLLLGGLGVVMAL